jgi:hypothetical protein
MMSKDRQRVGPAVLAALVLLAGAGSAGATDAPFAAGIGAGIDHTKRAPIEAAQGQVSAAVAVDLLNRPAVQPLPTRQSPQGLLPTPIGGLRGLVSPGGLDAVLSGPPPAPAGAQWTPPRRTSQASPYVRIREYERVLGISFKIQPPQQSLETASPGL